MNFFTKDSTRIVVFILEIIITLCQDDQSQSALNIPALGRTARLGSLYNHINGTFTGISILKSRLPASLMETIDAPSTDTNFKLTRSQSDKGDLLGVNARFQLEVGTDFLKISGSGEYLNTKKKTAESAEGAIVYKIRTKDETIKIFYDDMRKYLSDTVLAQTPKDEATHVVIGIRLALVINQSKKICFLNL